MSAFGPPPPYVNPSHLPPTPPTNGQASTGYPQNNVQNPEKQQYELMAAGVEAPQPMAPPPGYQTAPQTPQQFVGQQQPPMMNPTQFVPVQQQQLQQPPPQQMYAPQQTPLYQQSPQPLVMSPAQQQQVQQFISTMPPEKMQALQFMAQQQQQQTQMFAPPPMAPAPSQQAPKPHFVSTAPAGLFGNKNHHAKHDHSQDSKQSGKVQRFLGDTLVGRFARASVQTVTATAKMPAALSPWGDNNPVTLPNVRYRDAILFTTFAGIGAPMIEGADGMVSDIFGADSFVSDVVSSGAGVILGSTIIKYGVFQIVEQAIDKGIIEHLLPEEEKIIQTVNVKSLQVGIKHKLMGVDADLRFHGIKHATNTQACEKGWFCPYLFASSRTPIIPRANDFSIAQFFGPFLGADYAMAHKLVAEAPHTLSMCDPDPTHDIGTNRLIVVFTAISPFRANMWSTSRRPGCGTIVFHVFDGCPALILPVTKKCPIIGWSPWTLSQMRGGSAYDAGEQHAEICEWLDTLVSVEHLTPAVRDRYVDVLGRAVSLVINGALGLEKVQDKTILGKVDAERAGVVMFRY